MLARELDIQATVVYERHQDAVDAGYEIVVHEGGTRSSKTYSILQWIITYCMANTAKRLAIVRATLAEMRTTVMLDFIDLLKEHELYNVRAHDKTNNTYTLHGCTIFFIGMDKESKRRGAQFHVVYINEAIHLSWLTFYQMYIRFSDLLILDYNPSEPDSFIYSRVLVKDGRENTAAILIRSTYLDNPFLPAQQQARIDELDKVDPVLARIFKHGLRAELRGLIFQDAIVADTLPEGAELVAYGLDFGGDNSETALVGVYRLLPTETTEGEDSDKPAERPTLVLRELVHEVGLNTPRFIEHMEAAEVTKRDDIVADTENSIAIADLRAYGWRVHKARKAPGSVYQGIMLLKKYRLILIGRNFEEERRRYKWRENSEGRPLNEPVDAFNHLFDAARYVALEFLLGEGKRGTFDPIAL